MIKINGLEIAETSDEFGIMFADGEEVWPELEEQETRDIAWSAEGATVIQRKIFVSVTEVAE